MREASFPLKPVARQLDNNRGGYLRSQGSYTRGTEAAEWANEEEGRCCPV
jgi:hypothetical protein